ncbi:hypothetical protein BFL28_01525 [Sphingomonas turrisvirgatae]|uniref:Uncharacterized protein n=1 Tax=Sphingomonas turrisvirgatae TaxID=1888892 RepID=A0A1E3LV85_9SPHN|nr:hypothetical protein BFL28_01525 [Sphingomonas turrisvirgatae]
MRGLGGKWTRRALAVMLTLFGAFITLSIWAEPGAPVVFDSGTMVASGRLQAMLNAPTIGDRIEGPSAGAPFTDKAGRKCRPFAQGAVDGTACQVEGGWRIIEMHQR